MSDLTPAERIAALRNVAAWLEYQLGQTRQRIRELEAQQTPVRYVLEPKPHPKHPQPALIHLADCTMPQRATSPVDDNQARIALTRDPDTFAACEFCAPGKALGIGE